MTGIHGGAQRTVILIDRLLLWIAGAALLLMMVQICLDVIGNSLLGSPLPLTNAVVTHYYMIAAAYLPLAATELRRAHVGVDLLVNMLPQRGRRRLDFLVQCLCTVIYAALSIQSWQLAVERMSVNAFLMEQGTRVSIWASYFIIPVGFGLVALLLLVRVASRIAGRSEPEAPRGDSGQERQHD